MRALSKSYLNWGSNYTFNDLVQGKGKGIVLLLQYALRTLPIQSLI